MVEYRGRFGRIAVDNWGVQVARGASTAPPLPAWFGRGCAVGYERADGWTRRTCIQWERGRCSIPPGMGLVGFSRAPSFIAPGVPVIVRYTPDDVIALRMTPFMAWRAATSARWRQWKRGRRDQRMCRPVPGVIDLGRVLTPEAARRIAMEEARREMREGQRFDFHRDWAG